MRFFALIIVLLFKLSLLAQTAPPPPPPPPPPPGVTVKTTKVTDTNAVDSFAEQMPRFPGGEGEFQKYLKTNIHYPDSAKKYGREGTVYVYFEVKKDGKIQNVKCMRGVHNAPELCEEAMSVISAMPEWEPGKMNGRNVTVGMTVPLRFSLH